MMRTTRFLGVPLVLGIAFACGSDTPEVVLTLSGRAAQGGCHFPVPGRPPVPCLEYFFVDATFAERADEAAVIEDVSLETCTTGACRVWGQPNPHSANNRYGINGRGTLVLSFAPLYSVDQRPDQVRVTATVVARDTEYRLRTELAVPEPSR